MTARAINNQQGLSLLEVLVAIAFVTISITAMVTISNAALTNVNHSRDEAAADQYARQAIEIARAYRDRQAPFSKFASYQTPANTLPDLYAVNVANVGLTFTRELTAAEANKNSSTSFFNAPCTYITTSAFNMDSGGKFKGGTLIEYDVSKPNQATVTSVVCYTYKGASRLVKVQTILANI